MSNYKPKRDYLMDGNSKLQITRAYDDGNDAENEECVDLLYKCHLYSGSEMFFTFRFKDFVR